MGSLYDLDNVEYNPRCSDVKGVIIIFTYSCAPITFILLTYCIVKMMPNKKRSSFLAQIILLIFFSEIMTSISKLLQFLKYAFEDTRKNADKNSVETPRGIICQIQIVISIFSDFCSLLSTLLLSFRCYEVIKSTKRIFDSKKSRKYSLILVILISFIFAISFLLIDRKITEDSVSYKYDLRDRCSYWCWLGHEMSLVTYSCFMIILIFNIIYACKTNSYLKRGYQTLLAQNSVLIDKSISDKNDNSLVNSGNSVIEKNYFSDDDQKRIDEIKRMKIKCLIYPCITIGIWALFTIYRMVDDIMMMSIDKYSREDGRDREKEIIGDNPPLQRLVEAFLVIHSFFSSIRGILYAFSFIVFEEKVFGNCLRKLCFKCFLKIEKYGEMDEDKNRDSIANNTIGRNSTDEGLNFRKSTASDFSKNHNDMNVSDYNSNV